MGESSFCHPDYTNKHTFSLVLMVAELHSPSGFYVQNSKEDFSLRSGASCKILIFLPISLGYKYRAQPSVDFSHVQVA